LRNKGSKGCEELPVKILVDGKIRLEFVNLEQQLL